eukprot:6068332-Prymnesium_polylepis.1
MMSAGLPTTGAAASSSSSSWSCSASSASTSANSSASPAGPLVAAPPAAAAALNLRRAEMHAERKFLSAWSASQKSKSSILRGASRESRSSMTSG